MLLVLGQCHLVFDAIEIYPEGAVSLVLPMSSSPANNLVRHGTILMYDDVTILVFPIVHPIPIASDVRNLNLLIILQ